MLYRTILLHVSAHLSYHQEISYTDISVIYLALPDDSSAKSKYALNIYIYIYRVIQSESAILWEMIVCVILSKKAHTNMGPILNGYRDNITTNITCIVIRRVNHHVLLMWKTVSEKLLNRTHVHTNVFALNHTYYHFPKYCRFHLNHPVYVCMYIHVTGWGQTVGALLWGKMSSQHFSRLLFYDMGVQPVASQVLSCGPQPHLVTVLRQLRVNMTLQFRQSSIPFTVVLPCSARPQALSNVLWPFVTKRMHTDALRHAEKECIMERYLLSFTVIVCRVT
jgi:hypothetical protein